MKANFKRQVLKWDGATVHMKEPGGLLGKYDLTKREMREVVMQTLEPASALEAMKQIVKILHRTYEKTDINQAANNAT